MTEQPEIIEPIMMKDSWDCGVACLCMLLSKPYGEVRAAIPRRTKVSEGLGPQQMRNIAKTLGCTTWLMKDGDASEIIGIMGLSRPVDPLKPTRKHEGHYVLLIKGVLYNPADGHIWTDIDSFFKTRRWAQTGILVRED